MSIQGFRSCPARLFCNDFQLKIINIIHFKVRTLKFYSCSNFFQHVIGPSFRATVRSRHIYIPPKTGRSYILPWFASMTQACPNSKPWNKGLVNFITGNSSVLCWDVHVWFRRFSGFVRKTRNLHISCREFSPLSHLRIEPRSLANIRADSLPLIPWCTNKPFCSLKKNSKFTIEPHCTDDIQLPKRVFFRFVSDKKLCHSHL